MTHVIRIGNYRLGKTLGKGSFGKVKLAEHELTGHKVAVKILNRHKIKSSQMDMKIKREIRILKLFKHPHIIRLYEVIETPTDIFMVMEFISGGELFDYIVSRGRLSEDEARRFFQQIISGVEYCHNFMVVHRDLKPENLLLDADNNVKIADFGLSNMMQDGDFLKTSCGSPNYAAPEVISGRLYAGPEVDVWSCGVILYALLCGRLPFDEENIPTLFRKIKEGIFVVPPHISALGQDLIRRILVVDPLKRITIPEIRRHPWFQQNLPLYLSNPTVIEQENSAIDTTVLKQAVERTGVDYKEAESQIRNGIMSEITVAYFLLLDHKKRLMIQAAKAQDIGTYAKWLEMATSPSEKITIQMVMNPKPTEKDQSIPKAHNTHNSHHPNSPFHVHIKAQNQAHAQTQSHTNNTAINADIPINSHLNSQNVPNDNNRTPGIIEENQTLSHNQTAGINDLSFTSESQNCEQPSYALGITATCSATEMMNHLYSVLKKLNMEWRVVGQFHIKATLRQTRGGNKNGVSSSSSNNNNSNNNNGTNKLFKMGLQIYKLPETGFVLDIRKLDGELLPFMFASSQINKRMKVVLAGTTM